MPTTTYTTIVGEIVSEKRASGEMAYLSDSVTRSVIALADVTSNLTGSRTYWPYGELRTESGAATTPYKFLGSLGVRTSADGLTSTTFRTYNASIGRWMQKDRLSADRTRYSYGLDNPTTYIDFNGLFVVEGSASAAAVGLGGSSGAAGSTLVVGGPFGAAVLVGLGIGYGISTGADYITGGGYSEAIAGVVGVGPQFVDDLPPITDEEYCEMMRAIGRPCTTPPWKRPRTPVQDPCMTNSSQTNPQGQPLPEALIDAVATKYEECEAHCSAKSLGNPAWYYCCINWCDDAAMNTRRGRDVPVWVCGGPRPPW
jgi:RHS repeat-associated protein